MARLQDYSTVTPTLNDKLLIVQSQGQGLADLKNIAVNNLNGTIGAGDSIRNFLTNQSIPQGVYFFQTRYASDNPSSDLTLTMIYKNTWSGTYSKVYAFTGNKVYFASTGSSVPSELTWTNIASPTTEDITSQVTWNETVSDTNTKVYCKNNVVYLNYQGESKTHSSGDILFTLPSGYRPLHLLYTPFVVNGATFGNFEIAANGQAKINQINSTSATGRIYSTVSFPVK